MSKKLTTEQFIDRAKKVYGDRYDYSLVQYKNTKTKVKIICHIHGVFEQTPHVHLQGRNCYKCGIITKNNKLRKPNTKKRKTTQQFIEDAKKVHGNKYNYKLVQYKNNRTKVKIICHEHGVFEQRTDVHLQGSGCPKCAIIMRKIKTTQQFIEKAYCKHGDKYNYKLVEYKGVHIKVKIICPIHGVFEQLPSVHLQGYNCPKCAGIYEKQYSKNNIPLYDTYAKQLKPYNIDCRRNKEDENVLEVKCMYCDRWYIPTINSVRRKINCINGKGYGECNLYCSDICKQACPTYGQVLYPKGYRTNTSREIQPALRKLVLKRDNYTCQKCSATDTELHCHHYEGIEINPIESADADNCITLCKDCHNNIHKVDKCGIKQYQRKEC